MGLLLAAILPMGAGLVPLIGATVLCGAGFGFFQTPNNRNMLLNAPRERSGAAGGMAIQTLHESTRVLPCKVVGGAS